MNKEMRVLGKEKKSDLGSIGRQKKIMGGKWIFYNQVQS